MVKLWRRSQRSPGVKKTEDTVSWSIRPDGTLGYISSSVEALRGITRQTAMTQTINEIHPPGSAKRSIDYFLYVAAETAAGRRPESFSGILEYYCADGSTFLADVFAFPVIAENGTFEKLLGFSRKLDDKQAEIIRKFGVLERHTQGWNSDLAQTLDRELRAGMDALAEVLTRQDHGQGQGDKKLSVKMIHSLRSGLDQFSAACGVEALTQAPRVEDVPLRATLQDVLATMPMFGPVQIRISQEDQCKTDRALLELALRQILSFLDLQRAEEAPIRIAAEVVPEEGRRTAVFVFSCGASRMTSGDAAQNPDGGTDYSQVTAAILRLAELYATQIGASIARDMDSLGEMVYLSVPEVQLSTKGIYGLRDGVGA